MMPSFLRFFKDLCCCCCCNEDPSDAFFAAGVEAWNRYEETKERLHLDESVRNHEAALNLRASGHCARGRLESLYHTAMALWAQCQLDTVTKENSSVVISHYEEALRLLPSKDKTGRRAIVYNNLGHVYFSLFRLEAQTTESLPATPSLDKAIKNYRSALKLRSARNDPNRPMSLTNLSIALIQKDSETDLTDAITHLSEAVELCTTKADHRSLLLLSLTSLATAYNNRYDNFGNIKDVVGKVEALEKILDLTDGPQGRLTPLLNLTNALWALCEIETNRVNDLDEAVRHGREALTLSDKSDKNARVNVLITLANVLSTRYTQSDTTSKNIADLDQAIKHYLDAIDPDPKDGSDHILCSSLASAIYVRCQDFGEADGLTLEDAISYNQEASHACPKDDPSYLKIQNNLGSIYLARFKQSGEEGDLVKGVQSYEDVVSHCQPNNEDYTHYTDVLKDAKGVLRDRRAGRKDTPLSVLTRHQSTRVTTRSRSSHESRSSTKRESSFGPLNPL